MQRWKKLGKIFEPDRSVSWMHSHAASPFADRIGTDLYKIYFSTRNADNKSLIGWLIVDFNEPFKILELSEQPVIPLGKEGCFDEDGTTGFELKHVNGNKYLYYVGWNRACTVPFRNSIGLAVMDKESGHFRKYASGPILDRSIHDPCFVASHSILQDGGIFKMWYLSCIKWEKLNDRYRHYYHIKYADSQDGINWNRNGHVCIDFKYPDEYAISVPRVMMEDGRYQMWYSYRGGPKSEQYRIGYAESGDGLNWKRLDDRVDLDTTAGDWDSDMVCYPYILDFKSKRYMLYNGNAYGGTGFGLAVME